MLGALDVIYQPGFTDYRALTAKQFEACIDIISVLYKTGKNKFPAIKVFGDDFLGKSSVLSLARVPYYMYIVLL